MKLLIIISSILLTSCLNRSEPRKADSVTKSLEVIDNSIAESDIVFDNFIAEFGVNSDLQKSRISFPLEYDSLGIETSIEKDNWKNDRLFVALESITYITNEFESDERSMERVFSWINTQTQTSKNYYFKKNNSKWYLVQIRIIRETTDINNENFYSFLSRFCQDSTFQKQRVLFPIKITSVNDDFEPVNITRTENNWRFTGFYFKSDGLAVIYYDFLRTFKDTDFRVLNTRGNGNGISATIKFQRINNKWFMTRLNDQST
jgi:hypothetical protein